ncbi:MAG: FtsX-like permease family protein [Bacteroidota bacterium]|nr:FtsX-like permease family protein [Bacteroidota bacterium]
MAWRDSRRHRARLILFTSSIILGIAALVAINSFSDNLQNDINNEAKSLLGADLAIEDNQALSNKTDSIIDAIPGTKAREINFASMILFPKNGGSRLVQIRALEGDFPFYGSIETNPVKASVNFKHQQSALLDETVMLQYDVAPGDIIKIGELDFKIEGALLKVPGQTGIAATVAPAVYIPMEYLEATGLLQKGSRIIYKHYFHLPTGSNIKELEQQIKEPLEKEGVNYETVAMRKESMGKSFRNLSKFLNLVGFIALLLGCVGVASAVHVYMKDKIATVAILRCIGLKGYQAFVIYLIQIFVMGLTGSMLGAALGSIIQIILPQVLGEFLPVEVSMGLSWSAIGQGIFIGMFIAVLFALLPLIKVKNISPLHVIRSSAEQGKAGRDFISIVIYTIIIAFVCGFSYFQMRDWKDSLIFTGAIIVAFLFLTGAGILMMWLVRKFFPVHWNFLWRQSLANLYRPNNQTLILLVSIGLGTALITTLYFTQNLLINQVSMAGSEKMPNMVVFDIQSEQKDNVFILTKNFNLPIMQDVPVVTMRLAEARGKTKASFKNDSINGVPDWAFNREYRVTYRDSLIGSETITAGKWYGKVNNPSDTIFISLEDGYAERMKVKVGDPLVFNVQGTMLKTFIGSLRKVEWNRVQSNFLVVFPAGILELAPQFHVLMTKVDSKEMAAGYQKSLVENFPNVSVIDLDLILTTLDEILKQISFVIKFMALFSIATGLLVLLSSVIISKYQRSQESVLLRTLGASKKQILYITGLEYFFLGSLASLSGILLALAGSYGLAYYNFETTFHPDFVPILLVYLIITTLTVAIGLLNNREVLNKPPLEVLRTEI